LPPILSRWPKSWECNILSLIPYSRLQRYQDGVVKVTGERLRWAESPRNLQRLGGESAPPGQRVSASLFENIAAVEMALLIKVVVDLGVNRAEFLKGLRATKPLHRPLSPSKWLM
jgi:hypothetical protein